MSSQDERAQNQGADDANTPAPAVLIDTANPEEPSAGIEKTTIAPLDDLKKLFSRVKDSMLRSSTSVEALNEVSSIISILSAQVTAEASPLTEDQTKFFYGEFFREICQRAGNCEIKAVPSQEAVAELMRNLVDLLASELKMKTPNCLFMVEQMRHIFDHKAKFYKHLSDLASAQNAVSKSAGTGAQSQSMADSARVTDLNEDEREWRLSLDVNMTVDVFQRDWKNKNEQWTKGKIVAVTGEISQLYTKNLKIKIYNNSVFMATYPADSPYIAPFNTLSSDQNWRNNLKKFDEVDAQDKAGNWHTGTVMWVDDRCITINEYEQQPMIRFCYRLYQPDGDKMDEDGRYFGSDEDEYIGYWTTKIQKKHTQTLLKDIPGNSVRMSDEDVAKLSAGKKSAATVISDWEKQSKQDAKDMEQITEEGTVIVAVERDICKSPLLVELLTRFSTAQGFESLLEVLAQQETSLSGVQHLINLITNAVPMYHKSFVDLYMERLKNVAETKLVSADAELLKPILFPNIEDIVENLWLKLMKRKQPNTEIEIGKYQLLTRLGILFLKQNFMQKRIDGAKAIDMVCNRALSSGSVAIRDTVKTASSSSGNVISTLVQTLKEADIIDLFFNRANIHEQLVMRSSGVLSLFLTTEELTEDQLTMIWQNCEQAQCYNNLIDALLKLSSSVKPLQLTSIIERVCQIPKKKCKADEIDVLHQLSYENKSTDAEQEPIQRLNQCRVIEFYWDFLTGEGADEYLNKIISNKAIFNFMDIFKAVPQDVIDSYFEKIQKLLQSGSSPFLALKIGHRYFKEKKTVKDSDLPVFAEKLEQQYQFLQLIIEELKRYSELVNDKVRQEIAAAEAKNTTADESKFHEKIYVGVFDHKEQIQERMEFLTLFTQEVATKISKDALAKLWLILVDNNLIKFDKKQLFQMLKKFIDEILISEDNNVVEIEDLCQFYRETIAPGHSDYTNLELEGFVCIQAFFVLINSRADRLTILNDANSKANSNEPKSILKSSGTNTKDKITSISSNEGAKKQQLNFSADPVQIDTTGQATGETGNSAITGGAGSQATAPTVAKPAASPLSDKEGKVNLMVNAPPSEMEGMAGLWRIVAQVETGRVCEAVVSLLIQVHTNLDPSLESRLSEFEEIFINSCVDTIQENLGIIRARSDEMKEKVAKATTMADKKKYMVEEKRISSMMKSCLTQLIKESEKDGTFGLHSHRSFAQGTVITGIEVTNEYNYSANKGYQKTFKIDLLSNMNFYQVKKLICKELAHRKVEKVWEDPPHPAAIKLNRKVGYADRIIKDSENGMLVQELLMKTGEKIIVTPRGNGDIINVPLLDSETKQMTQQIKDAVKSLFDRFAISKSEAPSEYFIGEDQVKELMSAVSTKASERPKDIMAYCSNPEDLSIMFYDDFLNYYQTKASEAPDMVRANLNYIGLRSDMQQVPQPGDSDHILNRRSSPEQMPRFKIGNDDRTFQTLLECLQLDSDTKKEANELILQACTNQRIVRKVLEISPDIFQWNSDPSSQSSLEFIYTMTMIEQILENRSEQDSNDGLQQDSSLSAEEQAREVELKNTWVPRFLKLGGLKKLNELLEAVLQELIEGRKSKNMPKDQIHKLKEIMSCGVNILKVFVTATVCGTKNDLNADIFSISQTSSALSKRLQQGKITAILSNKYLRRADKAEEDLEAKLEEACTDKNATTYFFGMQVPKKTIINAVKAASQNASAQKEKDQGVFKPEDITEDMIFGNDIVTGGEENVQEADTQEAAVDDQNNQANAELDEPSLSKANSVEHKPGEKERIHFITVTDRNRQIAKQITQALNDPSFAGSEVVDFDRLLDFSLEAATVCMLSQDTDKAFERAVIAQAFDVWCACAINKGWPMSWERKPTNMDDQTKIRNLNDLIREGLLSYMPEVRRYWFQSLSLVCESLSQGTNRDPYQMIINELITQLNTLRDEQVSKISEEYYELLADCCLHQYQIEREMKHNEQEITPVPISYKDVLLALIKMLKRHNSFVGDIEKLELAKALESLLLGIADIFSFLKYIDTYDEVLDILTQENLIEYIFYEVIFFVPGKTQGENRNKAKRAETRKAGYQLLFKLLKYLRPGDMTNFLQDMFYPMIESVPRPVSWSHQPSTRIRKADDPIGIKNLGNVCYMISMLQQLYMIPAFRYSLLKVLEETPPKMVDYKDRMIDDNMLRQLQNIYGYLEMSERAFVDPTEFCFSFKQWNGEPTNTGEQRDAQEFLNEFFDKLENLLKNSSQKYLLADTFQGTVISQKVCKGCNYTTRDVDPFYTQTLYVENQLNVYESLTKQIEGELIDGWRCSKCNNQVDLCKSQILGKLPNVLVLHLQRIVFDFQTYENKKLTNRFEYPWILDLAKYGAKQNIELTEEEKADPKNKEILEMLQYSDEEYIYRLVGVCIHRGTGTSGHYWSLIHMKRGDSEPDPVAENAKWEDLASNWKEFNDDTVSFSLPRNVQEHGYGGGNMTDNETKIFAQTGSNDWSKSAYMLVYEKKLKHEIRQVAKEEGKEEEIISTVNFNQVEKKIPDWLRDVVTKDNRAHVADQQVFHPLFFTFASQVLKHVTSNLLDMEDDYGPESKAVFKGLQKALYDTGYKLSFDLLTHFKELDSIKAICSSLRSVFSWSDPAESFGRDTESPSLLVRFLKEALHADKCEYLFKIMYDSSALKDVRDQVGRTVARVLVKAMKLVGICREDPERKDLPIVAELATLSLEIINNLFAVMSQRTFQSKWSKLAEYFEMLSDIGIDEGHQAHFLLTEYKEDLVVNLCDFMLQQKSPKALDEPDPRVEMGGSHSKPAFGPLVALASHLVRCQWTKTSVEQSPTFAKRHQKDKNAAPENMMTTRIDLPDVALEYFTNSDLFELIMSNDYDVSAYAKGLAHVCYGNEQLSKQICRMARDNCFEGSHRNYLVVLRHVLRLDDKSAETGEPLQPKRLEWVFGAPQVKHALDAEGKIQLGLSHLGFNINSESVSYVTALCDDESQDQVSVLKLLLTSYCVSQLALDQATIAFKDSSHAPASDAKKNEERDAPESTPAASNGDGIEKSSALEQLRVQGMPEDQIQQMAAMMGENYEAPGSKTLKRSKSDTDVAAKPVQVKKSATGVTVDKNLDLDPLEELMRIISNDNVTMGFFAKIPGFTYQYARYTDWIGQYLYTITDIDKKDNKTLSRDQKASLKVLNILYARYEDYLENGPSSESQSEDHKQPDSQTDNVEMIDTGAAPSAQQEPPMQFMLLKAESESDSGMTIEANGLSLTSLAVKCAYVDSKPNNFTNLGVDQAFLTKYGTNKPKTSAPKSTSASQPAGDQDQAVPDNLSTEAQANMDDAEQGGTGAASDVSKYTEPATIDDLKIDMDDPAIQHALTNLLQNQEFMWVFELPEEDKMQAMENICKDEIFKHVKEFYSTNAISLDGVPVGQSYGPQPPPASAPSQPQANQQDGTEEAKEEDRNEDPFSQWQGDEIRTCDDLVYVLKISNTTDEPMKFRLDFNEGMAAGSEVNLVWPREGLLGTIKPNELNKVVTVMPKIRASPAEGPLSEIQKLQVTLTGQLDNVAKQKLADAAGSNVGPSAAQTNTATNAAQNDKASSSQNVGYSNHATEEKVNQLMEMGFEAAQCKQALETAQGDVSAALNFLFM